MGWFTVYPRGKAARRRHSRHNNTASTLARSAGRLEVLESRTLLTTFYVDNQLTVTADRDNSGGLSPGDQVKFGGGQSYQKADLTYDAAPVVGDVGVAFNSIGQALASSLVQPGDTIEIAGGTYVEGGLTIDKSLTLQGEGDVVIAGPSNGAYQYDAQPGLSIIDQPDRVAIKNIRLKDFETSLSDTGGGTLDLVDVSLMGGDASISNLDNLDVVSNSSTPQTVIIDIMRYAQPLALLSPPPFGSSQENIHAAAPPSKAPDSLWIEGMSPISFSGVKNLLFATGAGTHDTISVSPLPDTTVTIDGGDSTPPGDTLQLPTHFYLDTSLTAKKDATGWSGKWMPGDAQPVNFLHIASLLSGISTQNVPPIAGAQGANIGNQVVAQFTDPAADALAAGDTAEIYWGDNSKSAGTITYDAATGLYSVLGSHVYAQGGSYSIGVMLNTPDGPVPLPQASAAVAANSPAQMTAGRSWTLMPIVGEAAGTEGIVTFSDSVHLPASDYSAEINWGDGSSSAGTISSDPISWTFEVSGKHDYAQPGADQIVVTILRNGAVAGTLATTAIVSEESLADTAETVTSVAGSPLGGTSGALLADFEEQLVDTNSFQATIDWGDGTTSAGTVVKQGDVSAPIVNRINWQVFGSHAYAQAGTYNVRVSLTEYESPAEPANVISWVDAKAIVSPANSDSPPSTGTPPATGADSGAGGDNGNSAGGGASGKVGNNTSGSDKTNVDSISNSPAVTPNEQFVAHVYQDLLGRVADSAGLAYWAGQLDSGLPRDQFVTFVQQSGEYRQDEVNALFQQLLNHPADSATLANDGRQLAQGLSREQLAAEITGSNEYYSLHGGSNGGFLAGLFQDALQRSIDAAAKAAFEHELAAGASRAQIAAIVFSSHEYHADLVQSMYQNLLHRNADASSNEYWAAQLDHGVAREQVQAIIAASEEYFKKFTSL